jgi:threonine dehydratase
VRVVLCPEQGSAPEDPSARPLTAAPALESVRYLGERFASAGLRTVNLVRGADLDARVDETGRTRVWLALEAMQVTGSFKVRGALAALAALGQRKPGSKIRVVAASAGNHAAGVAYAAHVLGALATVVMPRSVPATKRERVQAYGAQIVLAPTDHYDDAEALAVRLAGERGEAFLSPYDDEVVVAGNGGSLGFEIARALGRAPDLVLAPFGGGGLATGLAWALARESRGQRDKAARVWGVQSEASPVMAQSLERGEAVVRFVPDVATLAEGLEGGISASAFARARDAIRGVLVVSEQDIAAAMVYAYRQMGLVLEGSAAAALAPLLGGLPRVLFEGAPRDEAGEVDLVVVLTGRNVDRARLDRVLAGATEDGAR